MKTCCEAKKLLTEEEKSLIDLISDVSRSFGAVVGRGPTREHDLREMVFHVHALQNMVLAQAAARAYPELYRVMGEQRETPVPDGANGERDGNS